MAVTPNSIVTPQTPRSQQAVCTAAKTTYGDAANLVTLFVAGGNGARITRLWTVPRATVTATQLQLYKGQAGSPVLYKTGVMAAYTMAQTTECPVTDFGFSEDNPLILDANEELSCAIGVALAGGIAFHAEGADY